ncbi:hypothetical protein V8C35DRAFT_222421 [Trichoderma chlorosporum]
MKPPRDHPQRPHRAYPLPCLKLAFNQLYTHAPLAITVFASTMLRDHDVHYNCFYFFFCALLCTSSSFLFSFIHLVLFCTVCASLASIITVLLPVITSFCCTWEAGPHMERRQRDIRISYVLDHQATLLCKHNRLDSLLFLLRKLYYQRSKVRQTGSSFTRTIAFRTLEKKNNEIRNGI